MGIEKKKKKEKRKTRKQRNKKKARKGLTEEQSKLAQKATLNWKIILIVIIIIRRILITETMIVSITEVLKTLITTAIKRIYKAKSMEKKKNLT